MITEYVNDVSHWKEWRQEYKYGVILIFPPEPNNTKISKLRNKYSWSQSSECEAHISLTVQIPRPVTKKYIGEIKQKLKDIKPFTIKYGPIIEKPSHPGVILDIHPQSKLKNLVDLVESTSLFDGALERSHSFYAHMTIAEMLKTSEGDTSRESRMEQTHEIINEIKDLSLSGEFELNYLSYAVPDKKFKFTERKRIYLGGKEDYD